MTNWPLRASFALACALAPSAAEAGPQSFQLCDGYGTPTGNGDGMTKEARGLFGLFAPLGSAGNTRRSTPALGPSGVAACDEALADPRLLDKQWLRRVSLIRARAMHDLAAANPDQALIDLDRAQAAIRTPDDPYIRRSLGLGIKLVRASALRSKGDMAGATAILKEVWAERRFSRQTGLAVIVILGEDTASIGGDSVLQALARLEPRAIDVIYMSAFNHEDFAQVVTLFPQLVPPVKTGDIGVSNAVATAQESQAGGRDLIFAADRRGRLAYALAALGRPEAAKAALLDARRYLTEHIPAEMPPSAPDIKEGSKARLARTMNGYLIRSGTQAKARLDVWQGIVDLRLALDTDPATVTLSRLVKLSLSPDGATLNMLKTMRAKTPQGAELDKIIEALQARLFFRAQLSGADVKMLFEAMPHTEIGQRIPTYRKANSDFVGYLWGGVSGFKTIANAADGTTTVRFLGEQASASVVEEMTLLRAADLARESGKSGIVIRGRRDYQRTQNTTYYGSVIRSDPIGYSSELDVEFVDLKALPERYRDVPWRVLPIDDVIADLGPAYMAPPADRPAR